jgi:nicotinate phosphoribosyltransferase
MIITSLLDLDLYKLTVGEVIFTYFRHVKAKYRLTVRNGAKIDYWRHVPSFRLDRELDGLKNLSLTPQEADYLRSLGMFSEEYIQFLMNKPMDGVFMTRAYQDGTFNTPVPEVSGEWCRTMLYEIFCLSIGNEIYASQYCINNQISMTAVIETARKRLETKVDALHKRASETRRDLNIVEFGTRRRLSKAWQEEVVVTLWKEKLITGTSNVYLAMKYDIPVRGTFGHEWLMGLQGLFPFHESQKKGFELWLNHWKGKLKIALDDTLGTKKFMRDFTKELAEAYDGLRHDSGPWQQWTWERLRMYHDYEINAKKKTLFYSDGLDIDTIFEIDEEVHREAKLAFGVGTNLTNDSFLPVPQVVMKIVECNGLPVCKLSNNPDKASCTDAKVLEYAKHAAENY